MATGFPYYGSASGMHRPLEVIPLTPPKPEPITLSEQEARVVYAGNAEMLRFVEQGHKLVVQPDTPEYEKAQRIRDEIEGIKRAAYDEVYEVERARAREEADRIFEHNKTVIAERLERELRDQIREGLERELRRHRAAPPTIDDGQAPYTPRGWFHRLLRSLLARAGSQ